MRIDFDDEEYPELSRYLENPKRKMKFLYFLETLFEQNNFDPVVDGLIAQAQPKQQEVQSKPAEIDLSGLNSYFDRLTEGFNALSEKLDGAFIGNRFPVEHVVHEVERVVPAKKKSEEPEEDFSDDTGIDFSAAIAAFED